MSRIYSADQENGKFSENQSTGGSFVASVTREIPENEKPTPFPLECLPETMASMVKAISETERVPESLPACCVLGTISASIGKGLQIQSGPSRTTPGNVYITASASSGTGKSEGFRHATQPFHQFEAELLERWKTEFFPGLEIEKEMLEAEINSLIKDTVRAENGNEREQIRSDLERKKRLLLEIESKMNPPVLACEDITTEKLANLLSKCGECLASLSPDAGAIVNNLLGRYSKLDRTDESIYLKAYSHDYCRIDRQSREPVVLRKPCVTALWLVQPDKVETLLGERSLTDGGLIPRILVCHTHCAPQPILGTQLGIPEDVRVKYGRLITDLLESYRMAGQPYTITPNLEAQDLLISHYNEIVERRKTDLRDVTTFAARWNEQAWRLTVVLHAGLYGKDACKHQLSGETAQKAIDLAMWFGNQQLEILEAGRAQLKKQKCDQVFELLARLPMGITSRDIQRSRIAIDAEEAKEILKEMEKAEFLQSEIQTTGGRPLQIFKRKIRNSQ